MGSCEATNRSLRVSVSPAAVHGIAWCHWRAACVADRHAAGLANSDCSAKSFARERFFVFSVVQKISSDANKTLCISVCTSVDSMSFNLSELIGGIFTNILGI